MVLDISLQIAVFAFTALLTGLGIEMTNNPPARDESSKKWIYRIWFLGLAALLICTSGWQAVRNSNEQKNSEKQAETERQKQEERYKTLKSQNDQLQGQLSSISNFVQHPPPNLTQQQISSAVHIMAGGNPDTELMSGPVLRAKADQSIDLLNNRWRKFWDEDGHLEDIEGSNSGKNRAAIKTERQKLRNDLFAGDLSYLYEAKDVKDALEKRFGPNDQQVVALRLLLSQFFDLKSTVKPKSY